MNETKWTDEYHNVYNKELERLRKYWPQIPEDRLRFWAEKTTDMRMRIS